MVKDLKSKNPAFRRKALYSLDSDSVSVFKEILFKDPSPVIRHEAAFLLGKSKNKEAVEILIKSIKTDSSDLVRHEAIEALGDLGFSNKNIRTFLGSLKEDKNLFIRDTAQIALLTLDAK